MESLDPLALLSGYKDTGPHFRFLLREDREGGVGWP